VTRRGWCWRRRAGDQPGAAQDDQRSPAAARRRTRLCRRLRGHGQRRGRRSAGAENHEPAPGHSRRLSILGTSGIVRPFSCAAYIASIHQGIDVAKTNGYLHIAACTGNASEDTMRRVYGLPEIALIEMGDFVGAVLKHLRKVPVDKLSLCGGFGKISKLAAGHMDLHSRHSSIDLPQLAEWAAGDWRRRRCSKAIREANTSQQAWRWPARRHRPRR
jgi:cobalt-precorrin-5B (C1)-methyltransferase